eukprot:g10630.t1
MILDKPLSVGHFGEKKQACVIYSVHAHPDGSRFATGGSDHRVRIWSMEPFRSPAVTVAAPPTAPTDDVQLLANLPQHTGSVLCVRWSHGGRYLASASDDTYVLIWELLPAGLAAAAPFGSTETPNVENWSRVCVLRGHAMDVLDCAWSPDDSMLVSCSIDNKVIVWRLPAADGEDGRLPSSTSTAKLLNPFQTLERHTSFVKGVAWDPIGRFVASIGAENRLLVWRVGGNWDVEATISEPFEDCDDTLVRRLSWSADGQFLVATNSKDGDTHNAVVLQRGRWHDQPTFLVGFTQATLAASFSPIIYKPTDKAAAAAAAAAAAEGRPKAHHVVAVAGQDNVITVWLAAAARPVVVLKEVFQQPPSDLSWGADGYTLVVSGYDGTVVVLRFTPEELGAVLPEADRQAHLVKIYGKGATSVALALDGSPSLVDNPRQLALERARKEQQNQQGGSASSAAAHADRGTAATLPQARAMPPPGPAATRPQQIESRGKSGKRRIQPMLLGEGSPQALTVSVPPPRGFASSFEGFGSAARAASAMDSPRSGAKRPRTGGNGGGAGSVGQQLAGTRPWDGTVVRLKSPRTVPMPMVSPPELMPRKSSSGSLVRQISGRVGEGRGDAFRAPPRIRKPPAAAGGGGRALGVGLALEEDGGVGDVRAAVVECMALEEDFRGLPARRYTVVAVTRGGREAWRDYVAGIATACCGNDRIVAVGVEDGSVYVYDRNGVRSAPPLVISPPVAYLECSDQRPPPQRQPPPPATSAAAAAAAGATQPGEHLMAISGDGDVTVWNLSSMTLVVKASLNPLFRSVSSGAPPMRSAAAAAAPASSSAPGSPGASSSASASTSAKKGVSVARAGVTPEGMPLVMLAYHGAFGGSLQAFTFHVGLGTWVRVADGRFALSDFYSSGPCTSPSASSRGRVLSALQAGVRAGSSPTPSVLLQASKAGTRPAAAAAAAAASGAVASSAVTAAAMASGAARESLQSAVTRAHLEDSLSTAVLLGSADEFLDVLRAYAGHLAKSAGFGHGRIRALCDKLLLASNSAAGTGASGGSAGSSSKAPAELGVQGGGTGQLPGLRLCDGPSVLGLDKLHLLREVVLPALSGNRSLQRLVSEYYDILDLIPDGSPRPEPPPQGRRAIAAASSSPPPAGNSGGPGTPSAAGGGSSNGKSPRDAAGAGSGSDSSRANGSSSAASKGRAHPVSSAAASGTAPLNGGTCVANGGAGVGASGSAPSAAGAAFAAAVAPGKGGHMKAGIDDRKQGEENGSTTVAATGSSPDGRGPTLSEGAVSATAGSGDAGPSG